MAHLPLKEEYFDEALEELEIAYRNAETILDNQPILKENIKRHLCNAARLIKLLKESTFA